MGIDLNIRARALHDGQHASRGDIARAAVVGAGVGTVISGAFHAFGPPKLAWGAPLVKGTLGVGLMAGLAAAVVMATNRGGDRSNNVLGSTVLSAAAFGVPGLVIHGKMDFSGKPVNGLAAAAGVALIGLIAGPVIHELTAPD